MLIMAMKCKGKKPVTVESHKAHHGVFKLLNVAYFVHKNYIKKIHKINNT